MDGGEDSTMAPETAEVDKLLDRATRTVGAHLGALYLRVPERKMLMMTTVTGVPSRLVVPWSRVALAAPVPVAEAARSCGPVWLADQQELARRFPRTALAFPYPVAMYVVPVLVDGVCWGAVLMLWPGGRSQELPAVETREIAQAADLIARGLRAAEARGSPVRPRATPLAMETPPTRYDHPAADLVERLGEGFCALDLHGRVTFLNGTAAGLLGCDRVELLGHRPWEVLPWLTDPSYENAYLAALFSRVPTGFTAARPDGTWLSFLLYPDTTGISMRIRPTDTPGGPTDPATDSLPDAPARAGTLFHLLHLASALTRAVSVQELTGSLTEQMMQVLDAQGLALLTADEGRLQVVGSGGFPPEMPTYFNGLPLASQTAGIRAIETGVPVFYSDTSDLIRDFPHHPHYGNMGAFAFLPLTVSGRTIGCCVLGYDRPRPFPPDQRAELTSLAGMIAQALERARLHDSNAQAARGLQDGLLPRRLPQPGKLNVVARYRPATHTLEVGGDFYDLIDFGESVVGAVIGDVQGHSVQAAAVMGQVRTAVHTHARVGASPDEILSRTNRLLMEMNSDLFCSCAYAHIDLPRHRVMLASAGHPPPILRHPDGTAEVLDRASGLLLGVEPDVRYNTMEFDLPPGALLALYTDGLVERPGTDLGTAIDRLAEEISTAGPEELGMLADTIIKRAEATVSPHSSDDIALLLVECRPRPARRQIKAGTD
ncbi:SpoIIE family protein phosphatase [Streptomyces sp. TS71-3]|uniref:SpoIIE family protein phosphatase n=1 Tax=Streptomyces sp. TS71-3 TaxID=2733862 RepID=UPI001B0A279B|nr:SpoIIE family protein phosphatase [Streptomyces sp. TS71-3]GHJ41159.1 hypothetical protein Sm713_67680 [Streptomyces sp. TS71-3]